VRHRLVGDEQRGGHARMAAEVAEVHAQAVVAAGAADVALAERMAAAEPRMAAQRLARLGDGRDHRRLEVERVGRLALGDHQLAMAQHGPAVGAADELERGVERRRRAQ
jgi:hypothetical protein